MEHGRTLHRLQSRLVHQLLDVTQYLTAQQVVFVHARLNESTRGSHGVRDIGLLQSAVAHPQATIEGHELYDDLFAKTAALLESLILNHPFRRRRFSFGLTGSL